MFQGCAISFGKGPPVNFIRQCQEKYGNTFTLHLAGRYLTYLLDPDDQKMFFSRNESIVDFEYATQPFLTRCFGVTKEDYLQFHQKMIGIVRSSLLAPKMDDHLFKLTEGLSKQMEDSWGDGGEMYFLNAIQNMIFRPTLTSFFGNYIYQVDRSFLDLFHNFDDWFEIASSDIPHVFLPKFTKAKNILVKKLLEMKANYSSEPQHSPPLGVELFLQEVKRERLEHFLLAMVWAGEANTIPTLFWCINYLLANPEYYDRVENEMEQVLKDKKIGDLTYKELLNSFPTLKNALDETIRLHAPPVLLRGARQDVQMKDYVVPQGQFLCLSPYWVHRNQYENGDKWIPEREKPKNAPFLSFGKGKYTCPGQSYAYLSMMLFLCIVISTYKFSSISGNIPEEDKTKLVGMTKPLHDIKVKITKK